MKKYIKNIKIFKYSMIVILSYVIMLCLCNFVSGGGEF